MKKISAKASDVLDIVNKLYAKTSDIQILAGCGKSNALKIKKTIREQLESEGYYLPSNLIPMDKLIDHLNINLSYCQKVAKNEK